MLDIRLYRPRDYEAVRELFSHAQDDFVQSYLHSEEARDDFNDYVEGALTRDLADIQRSYLEHPGSNFWVAAQDGETVGCIGAYQRGHEEVEIRRLAVHRDARRHGIASQLLDHAEAFARDVGYARTIAWTYNHMPGAIAFLRGRGYRLVEDHAFPHTSLTLYLYALEL